MATDEDVETIEYIEEILETIAEAAASTPRFESRTRETG